MTTATTLTLEDRVAALEAAVEEIQQEQRAIPKPRNHRLWLKRVSGSVTDHELFDELLRQGRLIRQADREPDSEETQP